VETQHAIAVGRIGEVVATSIAEFEAQSDRLHESPPLGALVRVRGENGRTIYGVVAGACTDGVDASVRPVPRGREGCEDAEVYLDNPDLVYVLRTCFQCLVVGYAESGAVYQHLPAAPAPIHYSVLACSPEECEQFSRALTYFRMILAARNAPVEEVLAAHVRFLSAARRSPSNGHEQPAAFSIRAGREIATLLRGDYQRATIILQCIRPAAV
jgi:hypothetical protein